MKFVINCTNLVKGGGLQVALSFLEELKAFGTDEYHVFLSPYLSSQVHRESYPSNFIFYDFSISPAAIKTRKGVVFRLKRLEKDILPDVVFTVFGPSYWRPSVPHVMGFAVVWAINPDSVAFSRLKLTSRIKQKIAILYKRFYTRRDADYYIVETEDVKARLSKYIGIDASAVTVVGNTCNAFFDAMPEDFPIDGLRPAFRLVTVSANYAHKNLTIIKDVIPELQKAGLQCQFVITVPEEDYQQHFGNFKEWIVNLGPIDARACPSVYEKCDALFLPTLLECFTASYPEAMKMGKPIITSDLPFARCLCGPAAEYFDPLNPKDIALKIINVATQPELQRKLCELGREQLKSFPTPRERASLYIAACQAAASRNTNKYRL